MRKYLWCYGICKAKILEITKQIVIKITMKIVRVLDVKKVVYDLSGPFAKIGAPEADNDSSSRPENFLQKSFSC